MSETSTTARTLRLLELLQARRTWSGADLAGRMDVTERTLRRDIDRLRDLGYRIRARRGRDGGYELAPGEVVPPLVFTAGEAAALAAALSSAAAAGHLGDEVALTAMAKLEHVLPVSVRHRVRTLRTAVSIAVPPGGRAIDTELLAQLALACRDAERLRIEYTAASGEGAGATRVRRIDPVGLVPRGSRWYLVCTEAESGEWRTLRVDRISAASPTGLRFPPRAVPGGDAAAFVDGRLARAEPVVSATVRIHAPLDEVREYLGAYAGGFTAAETEEGTTATDWRISDVRVEVLASALVWLVWPFEVLDSRGLRDLLRDRAVRFAAAAAGHA